MAETDFTIRQAAPEDAAAVSALLGELGYEVSAEATAKRLRQLASSDSDAVYVYLATGSTVPLGVIAMHWTPMLHLDAPAARITALVVSEKARREGVGRRLIDHAVAAARAAGCGSVELTTALRRAGAHTFYRDIGFSEKSRHFHRDLR
jgi:GNAT superfamily N-acetyltransferase